MAQDSQHPGGTSDPLPNNFGTNWSRSKSSAPKISGSGGGNATGPELSNQRGQQQNSEHEDYVKWEAIAPDETEISNRAQSDKQDNSNRHTRKT